MGCCFAKRQQEAKSQELSTTTNAAITCKYGLKGKDVRVVHDESSNSYEVTGQGTLLGSCALDCDCARWEIIVGESANNLQIGVKRYQRQSSPDLDADLQKSESDKSSPSFVLSGIAAKPGDVIGVHWDQTDLPMLFATLNGQAVISSSINRVRPSTDVFPAVSVSGGSSCKIIFDENNFVYPARSSKFKMIICSTNLI